jgi:CTP synthase
MQILELPNHPFFVGVQFHPEFSSKPLQPNPLYVGFIKAALFEKVNH